jgi:hypothetical protein
VLRESGFGIQRPENLLPKAVPPIPKVETAIPAGAGPIPKPESALLRPGNAIPTNAVIGCRKKTGRASF